jgi:ribonuclease D
MAKPTPNPFPPLQFITATEDLAALCARLADETFITIDTEFLRERTYYPELCLVQIAGESELAVIDALAPGLDLAPLGELMALPNLRKVFHAARQDVEIFLNIFGAVPLDIFDTQIAAMVAGYGDQVGYDSLVQSVTGGQIDKAHRFSDWSARPLSPAQLNYAAADVTYLRQVYERLCERLDREGRLEWVAEEMGELADPNTYRADPETIWERLRPRTNNRRMLGLLQAICAWREREAQRVNIPRQRLLKDESLLEIAATAPTNADSLARVRGISKGFAEGKSGQGLLAALQAAHGRADEDLPQPPNSKDGPRPSPALVALLKVLLAAKAEAHNVAAKLIASSDDLDRLAAEDAPEIPALHGWRYELFGADAQALKAGEIALGVNGKKIKLIKSQASGG